jgi:predicted transport protein
VSDIRLFRLTNGLATELQGASSGLEKPLQNLIERNLEPLLGIRFLDTEYSTGKTHAGRIDSLGIDEDNSPVIIEYKRSISENVINQGLFYLDWLLDHQAEFTLLVMKKLGAEAANSIDWSVPRLVCVAADFTKYDSHAIQQINRNIELIRYRQFGPELLLLELVNARSTSTSKPKAGPPAAKPGEAASGQVKELFEALDMYLLSLGDDVQRKDLKLYAAYKRIKNFCSVVTQKDRLLLYLRLNPDLVPTEQDFSRDVRNIGHWGTGDLEVSVKNHADLERAKPLILRAYEGGPGAG